ncbi:MAG: GNAT family N-acetyltransferase [Planctomycetota bacterium]
MSIIQQIRRRGVLHSFETLFNRWVPAWLFRFSAGVVMELDLEAMRQRATELDSEEFIVARVEDPGDRKTLREVTWNSVPLDYSEDDYGYSIQRSDRPGRILGGVWAGKTDFIEADLGFELEFSRDQAWLYCAYVDREARGVGAYGRVLAFAGRDLWELGYRQLLVIIQPWNGASMHVHQKYQTRRVGRIAVLRVGPFAWVMRRGEIEQTKSIAFVPRRNTVRLRFPRTTIHPGA